MAQKRHTAQKRVITYAPTATYSQSYRRGSQILWEAMNFLVRTSKFVQELKSAKTILRVEATPRSVGLMEWLFAALLTTFLTGSSRTNAWAGRRTGYSIPTGPTELVFTSVYRLNRLLR